MKYRFAAVATLALAVSTALGFVGPSATAQSVHPVVAQSSSPSSAPTPSFSEAELKVCAAAVVDVQRVTDIYLPKLKAAATIEDQQRIDDSASAEMTRVVETRGM